MSTKIFNGYCLNLSDINQFFGFVKKLRGEMKAVLDKELARMVAWFGSFYYDYATIEAVTGMPSLLSDEARNGLRDFSVFHYVELHIAENYSRTKRNTFRGNLFDLEFEVVFIPDDKDNRVYCLVYAENPAFQKTWEEMPEVMPFHYWNNVDPPEDIPEDDWYKRGEVWNRILGYDPPVCKGLTFTLVGDYLPTVKKELVEKYIPTYEQRVKGITRGFAEKGINDDKKKQEAIQALKKSLTISDLLKNPCIPSVKKNKIRRKRR